MGVPGINEGIDVNDEIGVPVQPPMPFNVHVARRLADTTLATARGSLGELANRLNAACNEIDYRRAEVDRLTADNERLRERTHEIASEAEKRFAPYLSRCADFDRWAQEAAEHFKKYTLTEEPFSGVPRTWWDMTSEFNRRAILLILAERDAAEARAVVAEQAIQRVEALHQPDFEAERPRWKDSVPDDEVRERAHCKGCATHTTFTPWSHCKTRAALAGEEEV